VATLSYRKDYWHLRILLTFILNDVSDLFEEKNLDVSRLLQRLWI